MPLKYIIFFTFIAVSIFANFDMPKKIIDQIRMATVAGYDYVDKETIQGTVVSPMFLQKNQLKDLVYTDTSSMVYENRLKLNAQASEQLHNGKLEIAFFNKELAENGLRETLDYLLRDPTIGSRLYLGIVEGSAYELLNSIDSSKGAGVYLSDLFEHNVQHGNLPETNLKMFSSTLDSKTRDPFLPMLNKEKGFPSIESIAFFNGDILVDSIPIEDANIFKMLYQNFNDGLYNLVTENYKASIQNVDSTRDFHVRDEKGSIKVTINVKLSGVVREYTKGNLTKRIPSFEKDLEKDFKKKANELIKQFQELNIDPLGIEEHVRSSIRTYDKKQFKAEYQTLPIDLKIKFKVTETGTRK
ncbi:Ger(x)C family spore germination protein [Virgibacillus salinus]|uniref:Spore germination protein n=1 Tax=Virgibacillus salinus TaxID=553311 RepID=A0A1H1CR96_9BACI|nr:Ger(x)C family spore germination protein [Virgibacillus salinus]SDQ66723.1 spore germination protein [Virgibacillus salinus]